MSEEARSVPPAVAGGSVLTERGWAVISDHYFSMNLTHAEALDEARDLVERKQHAVIVTNEAAKRMVNQAAGVRSADAPDMRF